MRTRFLSTAFLLLFTAFTALPVASSHGQNFGPDGTFEKDANNDMWPDGWGRPKSGGSWVLEDGNHFIRLVSGAPNEMVMLYQPIDIPATAKALELTCRMRVTNLKKGSKPWFDARIMTDFKGEGGAKLKGGPAVPIGKDTNGWVEKSVKVLVPEGTKQLDVMPTLFQVQSGQLDIDDLQVKATDPKPLEAEAKAKQAAAEAKRAEKRARDLAAEAPKKEKWPQPLHVQGNQVLNASGQPVLLRGVNVVSLEWSVDGESVMKTTQVALENWKANIIRLPVKESYWFGEGASDQGAGYRKIVDEVVTFVANRGAYLLLDLHRFKAPRQEHADFWKDAAARYKDHPAVLFDLFNEPHGTSWEVWRNGGFVAEKKKKGDEDAFTTAAEQEKAKAGFQAIGMQALLDAARSTGAKNVVLVGGLDYAYDLSGIAKGFALEEKGGNGIIYSTHIYPWKKGWQEKVLLIADQHPILVGECGGNVKKMSFIPAAYQENVETWVPGFLGLVQKYKLHWTAFCLHPSAAPRLISDWKYTPTPEWGEYVQRALAGAEFTLDKVR